MFKHTILALCFLKLSLAINWSMGGLSQCGEMYLSWTNATDGDKTLLCVPTTNSVVSQNITIPASAKSPYNVAGIRFPQATDFVCALIDGNGLPATKVSLLQKVQASSNTTCIQIPYKGKVVDFYFRMSPSTGPYAQCSSIYFDWDWDYVAPASLLALEIGGKIWEIFHTDTQGMTSFTWDKVNITAGETALVSFPDSGQYGTGGASSVFTISSSDDASCLTRNSTQSSTSTTTNQNLAGIIAGSVIGGLVLIGLIILGIFIFIRRRQRDDPQHPRQSIFGSKGASSNGVSHPDIDGQGLSRAESTAHFASGSIVPFASRESRGSMSPTRESLDTPYGFGVLGDYDAPRGDDFTARPGIRPSMDYSYMSGTRNEASPDLSTTESSREQATTPHAGEMREKRGASRALFGFNTRSNSEEVQPSSSNRSSGLQTRPRTTSLLLNKPESTSPQESDVDGSTLVIRHVDSGNRSGEPSMSRVVELPPEYADRSPVPSRLE